MVGDGVESVDSDDKEKYLPRYFDIHVNISGITAIIFLSNKYKRLIILRHL